MEKKNLEYPYNFLAYLGKPYSELQNLSDTQLDDLNFILSHLSRERQCLINMRFKKNLLLCVVIN